MVCHMNEYKSFQLSNHVTWLHVWKRDSVPSHHKHSVRVALQAFIISVMSSPYFLNQAFTKAAVFVSLQGPAISSIQTLRPIQYRLLVTQDNAAYKMATGLEWS